MDDEAHHGTPELAPGLRRLNGTELILWGYPDRITPVSFVARQRLPFQSLNGQAPVGPPFRGFFIFSQHESQRVDFLYPVRDRCASLSPVYRSRK